MVNQVALKMDAVTSSTLFAAVAATLCAAPAHATIKYVAHRGDYPDVPEGSLAAYRNAVRRGSEIVKLDVHPSKDGVIVLSHDPSFRRTMGWDAKIADVTWEEIRKHTYLLNGKPTEERAVSLPEALEVVKAIPEFWIDFKHFDPDFCERVLDEFTKVGIGPERLTVATYNQDALRYMMKRHQGIRRIGHMDFLLQDGKWSPSFLRHRGVLYAPAKNDEPFAPEVADGILSYAKELGLWGVNTCSDPRVITSGLVAHLKEEGLMASIALIHDAATAAAFAGHRPDCVVTRDRRTVKPIMDNGTVPSEEETGWVEGESAVLPPYNEKAGGWYAGYRPQAIRMWEIAARQTLLPETVRVVAADGRELRPDVDFKVHPNCGDVGLIGEAASDPAVNPVSLSYGVRLERLDVWYRKPDGSLAYLRGVAVPSRPALPIFPKGAKLVATRWVRGGGRMDDGRFFVNQEPFTPPPVLVPADKAIPKTLEKLRAGEPVKILAWGDSVTECSYLHSSESWHARVAALIRARFPKSAVTLVKVGWGGRNMKNFLDEPPGSQYNYAEKVLAENPDLVISEFVNDAWMKTMDVERFYGKVLADFRERGIEWVAFTPHYITPDWMGLKSAADCDEDPREYVQALRAFAVREGIGLADAAARWGHLWREGIPYPLLFVNGVNHPDATGIGFFVDAFRQFLDSAD